MCRSMFAPALVATLLAVASGASAQTDWEDGPATAADDPAEPAEATATEAPPPPPPPSTEDPAEASDTDGAAEAPPAAPVIIVTTAAPEPLPKESRRTHDGFYARVSLGHGPMTALFSDGYLEHPRVSGTGGGFDLLLGGMPVKKLVVGGGLLYNVMESQDLIRPNHALAGDAHPSLGLGALGPFVDFFPNPKRGLHFGGMIGLAGLGVDTTGFADDSERMAGGGALGLWVGYDWWVAREWSLGVNFRYLGVAVENEDFGWTGAADTFTLSFTVLAN